MGGKRNRQKEPTEDWEASGTDESYTNASGSHKISELPSTGAVGERGDSNGNGHTDSRNGGGQSRQGNTGSPPKATLGPWTNAVGEAVKEMGATQRAINNLQELFITHMNELSMVDEIRRRLGELEKECREKDQELQMQEHTISTLTTIGQKASAKINDEWAEIDKTKKELEKDKAKQEARIAAATAEERYSMNREFEKRTRELNKSHETRMKELEDDFARKSNENSTRATVLEADNERLSTIVQQHEGTIKVKADELDNITEQYDILIRAKNSLRGEKQALETELKAMKQEFGLNTKPTAYFEQKFAEIYGEIEGISLKYFYDIEETDLEKVHEELAAADPCFESVPLDDSDDSCDLRTAHAQRIISKAICEDIWKTFHSEFTLHRPEFSSFLVKISDNLDTSSHDGRTANVWTALTMRALQSIQADTVTSPGPESKQYVYSTGSIRADSVISKVFRILSPLVSPSQTELLRTDLLTVVNSSIDVWNNAQAGDLKIFINPLLDRAHHEEWRSQRFDPASPSSREDGQDPDLISKTHPRILTLFPRVMARIQDKLPPGSWPKEELTVIHTGIGLPEWSSLVVRGKNEQEEKKDYLTKALENAKKELHTTRRGSGHSRRESKGSLTLGLPSSSTQWKMEGAMKFVEG